MSKFHLVVDGKGLPLALEVTAGQAHDSTQVETVMEQIAIPQPIGRPRKRPSRLAGDKAYSCQRVCDWLKRYGIKPAIPHKDNEHARYDGRMTFDKERYKRRGIVEQDIGWLNECQRIGIRFEKRAMISRCLKILFSDKS